MKGDAVIKGYYTASGYVGFLNNGKRMLFATEQECKEYIEDSME